MELSIEAVEAYKKILLNPSEYALNFKPINECFSDSDVATPKHVLYEQFTLYLNLNLPKIMFYIIMDDLYAKHIAKAPSGDLGYLLTLKTE